ncbi:MAG: DUF2799 domain-containing protein, partial [Halobacteriovoraceae bacterium]|nr:DUF2799 domain-containing protein [Halobacteriovoraceae bacterium]
MKKLILIFFLFIASCTTLTKEDCQSMNWFEKGRSDAMNGKTIKAFSEYNKTCSQYNVTVDHEKYASGRVQGLTFFCTYENGQLFGRGGEAYLGICPQKLEPEFLKGYYIGKKEAELKKKEQELELREQDLKLKSQQTILTKLNTKQCMFNSDCTLEGNCTFGKCEKNGNKCSFSSDCKTEGRCSLEN